MTKVPLFLLLIITGLTTAQDQCKVRSNGKDDGILLCFSNATSCDTLPSKLNHGEYFLSTSYEGSQRLESQFSRFQHMHGCNQCGTIEINQNETFGINLPKSKNSNETLCEVAAGNRVLLHDLDDFYAKPSLSENIATGQHVDGIVVPWCIRELATLCTPPHATLNIVSATNDLLLDTFDYNSIMLYGNTAFSACGRLTSFCHRSDKGIILNILNRLKKDVPVVIVDPTVGAAEVTIPSRSFSTFVYWPQL